MNSEKRGIDPRTLRRWLDEGREVTVLDIRKAADWAEWSIPGSVHFDAYDALKANDPAALANLTLPSGVPVVTVCGLGKTAQVAAQHLAARGIDATPLEGGMKAWSGAWNCAEIALPGGVRVIQLRRTGKGCLSYLISSDGEAAVIDASLDPQVYLEFAEARGWKIKRVVETHVHADHLSRSRLLAQESASELHLPEQDRVLFPFTAVRDGDAIPIGSVILEALRTPGHTLESTCYLLGGPRSSKVREQRIPLDSDGNLHLFERPIVFTGDTLFPGGVGRPDLGADQAGAQERAAMLYQSLHRLLRLESESLVLPGHHSKPIAFDGKLIAATLGDIAANLPILSEPETSFVAQVLARIPATPPNYLKIVKLNETGAFPDGDPSDLEAGANRCAVS
jgi:glyoxylase-like metal-dependent hydrolase (beta-lactamase superfamily II)/rhodanese-related sulfurtransferase